MTVLADEPKAVIETRVTHDMHRVATALLAEAALRTSTPVEALAELREFLVKTLHHHHETEDELLWPLIIETAPHISSRLAELSVEHDALEAALKVLDAVAVKDDNDRPALREAAVAVRDLVHQHLSHEEPLLFPALREFVSAQAWAEFSQRVIATSPPEGAHLLIGFFDRVGNPDEVAMILSGLPEPAKAFVPAMREQATVALRLLDGNTA
jgi:hemerythrin-like domain-containing protein